MRNSYKKISLAALSDNYRHLKRIGGDSKILAVIKCNAYGHGLLRVAKQLAQLDVDGLAVASVQEGVTLREAGIKNKIVVLQGANYVDEFIEATNRQLSLVVHFVEQLSYLESNRHLGQLDLWIKFDTGMNRLGFSPDSADDVIARVMKLPCLKNPPVLMSHFCCMQPGGERVSNQQWDKFHEICAKYDLPASIANSAAYFQMPQTRLQWSRIGIALYGAMPPVAEQSVSLKPVMELFAPIIAIKYCRAGEGIGYGHRYIFSEDTTIGIVAIGYGDGYSRGVPDGTPVWINGRIEQVLGMVSMDMIAISINPETTSVGDVVELWGHHVSVMEVAERCDTISYQLLTMVGHVQDDSNEIIEGKVGI